MKNSLFLIFVGVYCHRISQKVLTLKCTCLCASLYFEKPKLISSNNKEKWFQTKDKKDLTCMMK